MVTPRGVAAAAWRVGPPVVVAIVTLAVIGPTVLRQVDFWDTGELQTVGPLLGVAHPTGFPTYVLLAWLANLVLAPLGEPALRMNVLSAVYVALAAAVVTDLGRALARSTVIGVAIGLGAALSAPVWALGTRAEAHALHVLFVAIVVRLLVAWEDARRAEASAEATGDPVRAEASAGRGDRWLIAAAVTFGLSMGNHSLTLLLALPIGLYVLAVEPGILRRPRLLAVCAVALVGTAALVFLQLPLRAGPFRAPLVYGRPETWDGFWYVVLAEQFRGSLVDPFGDLAGKSRELVDRTVEAFGWLAAVLPIAIISTIIVRPRYALLSGSAVLITCWFAASYQNADIGRYYAGPILFAWTWLAVLGGVAIRVGVGALGPIAVRLAGRDGARRVVRVATAAAVGLVLLAPTIGAIGPRTERLDRSAGPGAATWLDAAFDVIEPNAAVVSWWSYSTPLWYGQHVEGRRPDIAIIDDRTRLDEDLGDIYQVIDTNLPDRPVYVIRADPREIAELAERYELEPIGGPDARVLTRVLGPREDAP